MNVRPKLDEIYQILSTEEQDENLGLLQGDFGKLLFFYEYAKFTNQEEVYHVFEEKMVACFDRWSEFSDITFSGGLAGVGLLLCYFDEAGVFDDPIDDFLSEVDTLVAAHVVEYIGAKNYDFLHGLIGIGFYLLKRKKYEMIPPILKACLVLK